MGVEKAVNATPFDKKAYNARYYQEHRGPLKGRKARLSENELREYHRRYYQEHREEYKIYNKRYQESGKANKGIRRRAAVRRSQVAQIKLESGCLDCGYNSHSEALQFDHRPGTDKLFEIYLSTCKPWDLVQAEIAKCDIVCANCHVVRTEDRRAVPASRSPMGQWRLKRRWRIAEIKTLHGCTDCGYSKHSAALQFDHRPGTEKSFNIGSSLCRSWVLLEAEMAKCDVVCANCHAIRTRTRKAEYVK